MGIFNIQLFKRKNPAQTPGALTKNEWLSEGMPLFAPLTGVERISGYQAAIDALDVDTETRTLGVHFPGTGVTEYRYVLDMNMIPANEQEQALTAYAMTTGKLFFYPKTKLATYGWPTDDIIGPIADAEIGALRLTINSVMPYLWRKYQPQKHDDTMEMIYYFNVDVAHLDEMINPLIDTYITKKYANEQFAENPTFTRAGSWKEDYLSLFLSGAVHIPVSGGDPIAKASFDDRVAEDPQKYRLSVFYVRDLSYGDVYSISRFFSYRQRLPLVHDLPTALDEGLTLAGHPLITDRTNLPLDAARVDFVDQSVYAGKLPEYLALDPDSHPHVLRIQKPPSAAQMTTVTNEGIDLTGHGTAKFNLFNPDGLTLDLSSTSNILTISPMQVGPDVDQAVISVSASGPVPDPMTITISSSADVLKEIEVQAFDFKLMPVSFWYLHPFGPDDLDFETMFAECNRVLGSQANVFIHPVLSIGTDARAQTLQLTGVNDPNQVLSMEYLLLTQAQQEMANIEQTAHDLNVILCWELGVPATSATEEIKALGAHLSRHENDPRPFIFIDITREDVLRIGSTLAHEIGHFIGGLLKRLDIAENDPGDDGSIGQDVEEFHHGRSALGDVGSSSFYFNLMYHARPSLNRLLTTRQAELFNQYTDDIS